MAIRVHVAAARGVSEEAFGNAFAFIGGEPQSEGEWRWVMASVWHTGGQQLDEALVGLNTTGLRATTEDACRWYLNLFAPGRKPFRCCHEFPCLEDWDDEDDEEGPWEVEDLLESVAPLTGPRDPALEAKLAGLSWREAVAAVHAHQAERLAAALPEYGIDADAKAVVDVLTGASVTEQELDTDIGNLPRLLVTLGLRGQIAEWLEQQTAPQPEGEACECEPVDYAGPILERMAEVAPVPIEGGGVELSSKAVSDVDRLAWFCDDEVTAALVATWPEGAEVDAEALTAGWYSAQVEGNTLRLGLMESILRVRKERRSLVALLERLPADSVVEVVMASEGELTSGNHRYRGPIEAGRWRITEAYPQVDRERLAAALALTAEVRGEAPIVAQDEDELAAVLARASRHTMFDDDVLKHDGLTFVHEDWQREYAVEMLFRRRFRDEWDVESAERREQEFRDEFQEMMEEMEESMKAPRTEEVVFEGSASRYLRGNVAALPEWVQTQAADSGKAMAALGMASLGDLVCEKMDNVVVRGYGAEDSVMYGAAYLSAQGVMQEEFYTAFDDGTSLTTSAVTFEESDPGQGVYFQAPEEGDLPAALALHEKGIAERREKGVAPLPATARLEAMAQAIDAFLVRRGF